MSVVGRAIARNHTQEGTRRKRTDKSSNQATRPLAHGTELREDGRADRNHQDEGFTSARIVLLPVAYVNSFVSLHMVQRRENMVKRIKGHEPSDATDLFNVLHVNGKEKGVRRAVVEWCHQLVIEQATSHPEADCCRIYEFIWCLAPNLTVSLMLNVIAISIRREHKCEYSIPMLKLGLTPVAFRGTHQRSLLSVTVVTAIKAKTRSTGWKV